MLTKQDAAPGRLIHVIFELPAGVYADRVHLVGEFNNWDARANPMERDDATGNWCAHLTLPIGRRYRFRYLVDGHGWLNDWCADDHIENPFGSYDSVIDLTPPLPPPVGGEIGDLSGGGMGTLSGGEEAPSLPSLEGGE